MNIYIYFSIHYENNSPGYKMLGESFGDLEEENGKKKKESNHCKYIFKKVGILSCLDLFRTYLRVISVAECPHSLHLANLCRSLFGFKNLH